MSITRVAITGGARGIGRATAEACLRAGTVSPRAVTTTNEMRKKQCN